MIRVHKEAGQGGDVTDGIYEGRDWGNLPEGRDVILKGRNGRQEGKYMKEWICRMK